MMYETCRRCGGATHSRIERAWGLCWYQGSRKDGTDRSTDCAYSYSMWLTVQPQPVVFMYYTDPRHQVLIDRWFEQGAPKMP